MISFSRLKKYIENSVESSFCYFSKEDKQFYKYLENSLEPFKNHFELELSNKYWHGFLDYTIENSDNVYFAEWKIRSNNKLDKWFVLQAEIYLELVKDNYPNKDASYEITVYNRKENFVAVSYERDEIIKNYPKYFDWATKIISFVKENYEIIDKECQKQDSDIVFCTKLKK